MIQVIVTLHSLHPEHFVVAQHLQTPWECPECKRRFPYGHGVMSLNALPRDGHRRSKARPRLLLLYHLFAPVGAPGNVGDSRTER